MESAIARGQTVITKKKLWWMDNEMKTIDDNQMDKILITKEQ